MSKEAGTVVRVNRRKATGRKGWAREEKEREGTRQAGGQRHGTVKIGIGGRVGRREAAEAPPGRRWPQTTSFGDSRRT